MQIKNINTRGHVGAHVTPAKYEAMRRAILKALPRRAPGMTWAELVEAVAPQLPPGLFAHMGSVRWYCKSVQLDLEARGLIERVPKAKPLRLRRLA